MNSVLQYYALAFLQTQLCNLTSTHPPPHPLVWELTAELMRGTMAKCQSLWRCDTKVHRTVLQLCSCSVSEGTSACPPAAAPPFLPREHSSGLGHWEGEGSGASALLALQHKLCHSQQLLGRRAGALKVPRGQWVSNAGAVLLLILGKGW